jgi:glyceraldehyde 3-phosphate dehydrogenase
MKTRIAINGFGRIGRITFRSLLKNSNVEVVAINDLTDNLTLATLLKFDSIHGKFDGTVTHDPEYLTVNGVKIRVYEEKDPSLLPWAEHKVDVVLDCTGRFTTSDAASAHLKAGAKKVIISAPATGEVKTIVLGVNDHDIKEDIHIYSNASCTTNCLAPMIKVLDENFGLVNGFMNTIHAYTQDQNLQDGPHKDLRRARAAAMSIVPTSTGAAKAVELVIPHLKGKISGYSMRVPVPDGSLVDFTATLKREVSRDEINAAFKKAAEGELKGIIEYTTDPIVSCDIIGNPHSCIFDSELTMIQNNTCKVMGWYDNEFGYSSRLAQLATMI